jgi:general secretion pathway protein D
VEEIEAPDGTTTIKPTELPPEIKGATEVTLDFPDVSLYDLVVYFARVTRRNFILSDVKDLQGKKVTILSHHPVKTDAAWEAFLSAMQVSGYTVFDRDGTSKVVKVGDATRAPIGVGKGAPAGGSDRIVTQLITLQNVNVNDVSKIVQGLVPSEANVTAYAPTNTLILTDSAHNLRRVYDILKELDVAAPKSTLRVTNLRYAEAADMKRIIEELYGTQAEAQGDARSGRSSRTSPASRPSRTRGSTSANSGSAASEGGETVGAEAKYIDRVIDDERTNSLIVLANEIGHEAVKQLVADLDRDVDPASRASIHVVYLEHAKAEEVAQVLGELSQDRSGQRRGERRPAAPAQPPGRSPSSAAAADGEGESSAIAAFDSGMRIAADESTNSLVIIASLEDFRIVDSVIRKLDVERKQVFVDAVVLELSSDDSLDLGLAAHLPTNPTKDSIGFLGGQVNSQSLGLSQDLLSGLAVGVFGPTVDVPMSDGTLLPVPAFGIVLNALKTSSSVNILSNPNLMALDNEEAKIVVGRKIPFPTTAGLNNLGQPVVSFQREDVAITLEMTPRVNSSNYVTFELKLEVAEVEEDDQGLNIQQSGPITSKRELETTALVKDNETVVLGGLVGETDTKVETKIPILGDIPLIGALFRGSRDSQRKTNLMIFLTPHIIDDEEDIVEIMRVKEAQRREFLRRFYGKAGDAYMRELADLLQFSMNQVDRPSMFRGPSAFGRSDDDSELTDATRAELERVLDEAGWAEDPGATAGELPEATDSIIDDGTAPLTPAPVEGP